jgi:DNA-binding response OmpR family regulator
MGLGADLSGMKILVVEDNYLVADVMCEALREYGCEIVGPAPSVEQGEKLIEQCSGEAPLHGALLDVNLNGAFSFPLAVKLRAQGVPCIFLTGYGEIMNVPDALRGVRRVSKPCNMDELAQIIRADF